MLRDKVMLWVGRCLAQKKRFATLALGLLGNWLILTAFDFVLYPYVLVTFGTVQGWAIMVALSIIISLLTLRFYDWSKQDWLGIEAVKSLRDGEVKNKFGKMTAWALQKSDPIMLVVLSIKFEPVITTLYMRHGQWNGFSSRDWRNFFASTFIANLYWGLIVLAGIDILQWLWAHLS